MEASILGAKSSKKYKKGMTNGVLPDYNKSSSNSKANIIIPTGLGLNQRISGRTIFYYRRRCGGE